MSNPVVLPEGLAKRAIGVGLIVTAELSSGGYWRRRNEANAIRIAFNETLIAEAGGIKRLLTEWEQVPE